MKTDQSILDENRERDSRERLKREAKEMFPKSGNLSYVEYDIIAGKLIDLAITAGLKAALSVRPEEEKDGDIYQTPYSHGHRAALREWQRNIESLIGKL